MTGLTFRPPSSSSWIEVHQPRPAKPSDKGARRFIFEDQEAFPFWCHVYGISSERFRQAVQSGVRTKVSRRDVERAILANPESSNNAIAKELGVHRERVRYWRLKMG